MEANELRIGNKLHRDELDINTGKWHQMVIDVSYHDIHNLVNGHQMMKGAYEGIALTEDWLTRAGFEKEYENDFMYVWRGVIFYFRMSDMSLRRDYKQKTKSSVIEIKYVHQLQNLYFALTGQELQFKP
jgi:hypothetical protein